MESLDDTQPSLSNLSHDSGLTGSDNHLDEECGEIPEGLEHRHDFNRSVSDAEALGQVSHLPYHVDVYSRSMDSTNPIPPPRTKKRKGSETLQPSAAFVALRRQPHPSAQPQSHGRHRPLGLTSSLSVDSLKQPKSSGGSNRNSTESLRSVDENAEWVPPSFSEFARNANMGNIIKSSSGTSLYVDGKALSLDYSTMRELRDRFVRQASVTESNPPLSPASTDSYSTDASSVFAHMSREGSMPTPPTSPGSYDQQTTGWSPDRKEGMESSHECQYIQPTITVHKQDAQSAGDIPQFLSPPHSPKRERRHTTATHRLHAPLGERFSYPMNSPPVGNSFQNSRDSGDMLSSSPKIKVTMYSSEPEEPSDSSSSQSSVDDITGSLPKSRMYGGHMRASPKGDYLSDPAATDGSPPRMVHVRHSSIQRSVPITGVHSIAMVTKDISAPSTLEAYLDAHDPAVSSSKHMTSRLTINLNSSANLNQSSSSMESDKSSDSIGKKKLPSYHQAIQRKFMMKHGIPLDISEQDTEKQKEASARAKELYEQSLQKYLFDDVNNSVGSADSFVQREMPKSDPREIYLQSIKMYNEGKRNRQSPDSAGFYPGEVSSSESDEGLEAGDDGAAQKTESEPAAAEKVQSHKYDQSSVYESEQPTSKTASYLKTKRDNFAQQKPRLQRSEAILIKSYVSRENRTSDKSELPWSVSQLRNIYNADTTHSRPPPPPYQPPPPFRRTGDSNRVSTSSVSSHGSNELCVSADQTSSHDQQYKTSSLGPQGYSTSSHGLQGYSISSSSDSESSSILSHHSSSIEDSEWTLYV